MGANHLSLSETNNCCTNINHFLLYFLLAVSISLKLYNIFNNVSTAHTLSHNACTSSFLLNWPVCPSPLA